MLALGHMVWQGEVFLQLYRPAGPHLLGIICTTCRPSSLRQLLAAGRGARATILSGGAMETVPLEGGGLRSLVLWLHAGAVEYSHGPAVGRLPCG